MPPMHIPKGVLVELLQDTVNGSVVVALPLNIVNHTVYIRGTGAVSGGAVQLASSSANGYSGTFAPIGTPVPVPANGETMVNIGPGVLNCLKVSFPTPVAGGTATVRYVGY